MRSEAEAIKTQIVEICWYMRGGINWDQAWGLSLNSIKATHKQIKQNIEIVKKTGLPII